MRRPRVFRSIAPGRDHCTVDRVRRHGHLGRPDLARWPGDHRVHRDCLRRAGRRQRNRQSAQPAAAIDPAPSPASMGRKYYVEVVATNAQGTSGPSWRVRAVPKTVPSAPGSVAVSGTPGGVNVTWTPAAENGATITKYTASAYTAGTGGNPVGSCTTSNGSLTRLHDHEAAGRDPVLHRRRGDQPSRQRRSEQPPHPGHARTGRCRQHLLQGQGDRALGSPRRRAPTPSRGTPPSSTRSPPAGPRSASAPLPRARPAARPRR